MNTWDLINITSLFQTLIGVSPILGLKDQEIFQYLPEALGGSAGHATSL